MPVSDAYVDVTCDECGDKEQVQLEYRYLDYSGRNGYYDDEGVWSNLVSEGWEVDEDANRCVCPECVEENKHGN